MGDEWGGLTMIIVQLEVTVVRFGGSPSVQPLIISDCSPFKNEFNICNEVQIRGTMTLCRISDDLPTRV